jgi:hypothetical protein
MTRFLRGLSMVNSTGIRDEPKQTIYARELSGAQEIEDHLLLSSGGRNTTPSVETSAMLDKFSKNHFRVPCDDILLTWIENKIQQPGDSDEIEYLKYLLDDELETRDADEDKAMRILLSHGVDFRDVNGYPMRMTIHLKCAIEMAAKGILGKLPSANEVNEVKLAAKLQDEVNKFFKRPR